MHRVELKGSRHLSQPNPFVSVPNAPCGVERNVNMWVFVLMGLVPNAPCGVESEGYVCC